jgi:signal transduction histidine kinase/ActR/RegA family two-component response regulator
MLIVLIVVVPAIGIISYDQTAERRRAHDEAVENLSRLAHLAANEQSGIFSGVQGLLSTIAMFPGVRDGDSVACRALLPNVLRDHPSYFNLFVTNVDGSSVCLGSNRPVKAAYASSPAWFTRAIQSRTTVIGDYQLSLTTGRPAVVLAHPIVDESGRVTRIVAAVIGLEQLTETFRAVKLPRGATLTLTDPKGTILARMPDASEWIGRRHTQFPSNRVAGSDAGHELHESIGSDGVRRLYAVIPVDRALAKNLYITLDIESDAIFADADRLLLGHVALLGLLTFGALALAILAGNVLVLQPMKARERAAEERMRFALEVSRVGVWEHLGTGDRVFWTETLAALHGITLSEFGGNVDGFLACVRADQRDEIQRAIGAAISKQQPTLTVEYTSVWPDKSEHRLTTTAHYSYDAAGRLTRGAGVTVDITEQRSLEEQLRQSQKMEAVGRLAGGVAHDFNNMLTAILGNAQFLANELPAGDPRRADVDEITKAGQRAAALTHQLLAFSRKQILAPKVMHLGDVVAQMAPMLRRLLGESIDLRTTTGDRSYIKADAGQIAQVLMNLAVNAKDAMSDGGRLSIDTTDIVLTADDARQVPAMPPGRYVLLTVTDTGHGMDDEIRKRIFEPFFTTKPTGLGTGLGLATVYGIVQQSGGCVTVTSEVDCGTTFRICLPQTDDRPPVDGTTTQVPPRGAERVLVVEDEPLVREFAARVLARLGYHVHAVESGAEAIRYAQSAAAIDLILSDVVLPVMSGPAMAAELERLGIKPTIIYMSGYTDDVLIRDGALRGGGLFIQKPFTSDVLARSVRNALDAVAASA